MKRETKKLIEWIKNVLEETTKFAKNVGEPVYEEYKKHKKDAITFLDTLPDIEKKLCFGGYIQDKNGTPCCQGDKVNVPFQDFIGTLKWDLPTRRFVVVCDNGTEWSLSSWEFEKVEE